MGWKTPEAQSNPASDDIKKKEDDSTGKKELVAMGDN